MKTSFLTVQIWGHLEPAAHLALLLAEILNQKKKNPRDSNIWEEWTAKEAEKGRKRGVIEGKRWEDVKKEGWCQVFLQTWDKAWNLLDYESEWKIMLDFIKNNFRGLVKADTDEELRVGR